MSAQEAPAVPQAAAGSAPVVNTSTIDGTKVAIKEPQKKHKHHKRDVIDNLEIEPRQILQRRRD